MLTTCSEKVLMNIFLIVLKSAILNCACVVEQLIATAPVLRKCNAALLC